MLHTLPKRMTHRYTLPIGALGVMGLLCTAPLAPAQTTFSTEFLPPGGYQLQVDLNGDGTPDFVVSTPSTTSGSPFALLSNGTGGYTKRAYPSSGSPFALGTAITSGDFNKDGRDDVFFYGYVYYGDGHGGFPTRQAVPSLPYFNQSSYYGLTGRAADFNGDGRADVMVAYEATGPNGPHVTVQLYLNNGSGFNAPVTVLSFATPYGIGTQSNNASPIDLLLGDYDSDGHADLALRVQATGTDPFSGQNTLTVLYGDGVGHFTPKTVLSKRSSPFAFAAADINDDTRTDLVGASTDGIHVLKSQSGRTFVETVITAPNVLTYAPMLADFDGNGRKDIGFASSNYPTDQTTGFRVLYQSASGAFALGSYKSVDTFNGQAGDFAISQTFLGDYNHDGKPDAGLALSKVLNHPDSLALLLNTGRYAVGSCSAPAIGIHVCSPGDVSSGQVRFAFSATSYYPLRKMEIWVDGVKRSETYHVFANEGFEDTTLTLTPGGHRIGLYSGDFDGRVQHKTFNIQAQ